MDVPSFLPSFLPLRADEAADKISRGKIWWPVEREGRTRGPTDRGLRERNEGHSTVAQQRT